MGTRGLYRTGNRSWGNRDLVLGRQVCAAPKPLHPDGGLDGPIKALLCAGPEDGHTSVWYGCHVCKEEEPAEEMREDNQPVARCAGMWNAGEDNF